VAEAAIQAAFFASHSNVMLRLDRGIQYAVAFQ
jgi:hypothetical protein